MIQPQNCPEDVQQFCQLLRLDPDRSFLLKPTEPGRSCWFLLSISAGTGKPTEPGALLFLCFRPVNKALRVADGYRASACLAVLGLSFPPSSLCM